MKSYILFIFGEFDDHETVEFFINDVLSESNSVSTLRYIIEDFRNLIIIFDSELKYDQIASEMSDLLKTEHIKFYFLFDKSGLIISDLPVGLREYIFKVNDLTTPNQKTLDIDTILDKIEKYGIENITDEEKNFLDNFEK